MNKRIRELTKQANGYWEYGDFNIPHSVYFAETDLEKFAELIVRECMDNLEWHGHDEAVSQLNWFLHNKIRS
jgi:hypothetical protein